MTVTTGLAARRARFVSDGVAAASPQTLLVMLYDRCVLDLKRAETAQRAERWEEANRHLLHGQSIVSELSRALDTDAWPGGEKLQSLYSWLRRELVAANVSRDAARTASARRLLEPLAETWRQAVNGASSSSTGAQLGGTA
ncbi:flagellar export chaperone FliS [Quadrisphaera sp. KR29]|uniref:flagellar export chaperone FliS n=1 Tax=Quadrisphaera sp. KR29 TaxID=3461391 RepID=UPI00404437D3